jgi:predicted Zn-dependent peptidase
MRSPLPVPFLALFACLSLAGAAGAQNIEREELDSGLTVITGELPYSHAVEVRVLVEAAAIHEGALLGSGVSRLLQRMILAGPHDPATTAALQRLGGSLRTELTPEAAVFAITTVDARLDETLGLLARLLGRPTLTAEGFEAARTQQIADLRDATRDWEAVQTQLILATVYSRHPARLPVDGTGAGLEALSLADVAGHHARRYRTAATTIVITGNIGAGRAALHRAAAAFADYPAGGWTAPAEVPEPTQFLPRAQLRTLPFIGSHRHAYAWRTVNLGHRDQVILDLVAIMLANPELVDLAQRLQSRLLTTDFTVDNLQAPGRPGCFVIRYSPARERSADVVQEIGDTLRLLRTAGPDPAALQAAKRRWLRDQREIARNTALFAADLGRWELAAVDPVYRRELVEAVEAVTPKEVAQVVERHLHESGRNKNLVVLEPPDGTVAADPPPPPTFSDTPPRRIDFDNDAILLQRQLPSLGLVFLRASIGGGRAAETAGLLGASDLLANLLAAGPAEGDGRPNAHRRRLADLGMTFEAYATQHSLELVVTCFPQDLGAALDLLVQTIKLPALPSTELDRLVQNARAVSVGLPAAGWQDLLRNKVRETLFAGHYAVHPALDDPPPDLAALTAFHRRLAVGANLVFSIYGQYDDHALADVLGEKLGQDPALPVGGRAAIAGPTWPADPAFATIGISTDLDHRGLALAWRAPPLEHLGKQGPAMDLLSTLLAGVDGHGGRLGAALGMDHVLATHAESCLGRGIWAVLVQAPPDRYDAVRKTLGAQVELLIRQLGEEDDPAVQQALAVEIDRAREQCAERRLLAAEDQRLAAERHARMLLLGQPIDEQAGYVRALRETTPAQLAQVAREFLTTPVLLVQLTGHTPPVTPPPPAPPAPGAP